LLFIQIAKIQALKKTATKGDKKKKKDVAEEIAKLETEIEAKHAAELKKFQVWLLIDMINMFLTYFKFYLSKGIFSQNQENL
jgi:hypothetical protein